MKTLQDILLGVALQEVVGATNISVSAIQIDSRKITASSVFVGA